jgi:hypothetical protein
VRTWISRSATDAQNIKVGVAYDDMHRGISGRDNSRAWQQAVCGGGGPFIAAPATAPACNGQAGSPSRRRTSRNT